MAIGINWEEVWKPVWDPVWQQELVEPPVVPPVVETGSTPGRSYGWSGVGYWPSEQKGREPAFARRSDADEDEILMAITLWTINQG